MKVLYDISVLGVGQYNPLAKTGVARVIENVASGLAKSKDCDLLFCESLSVDILNACLSYCNSNQRFKTIPIAHSSWILNLYNKLQEINKILKNSNQVKDTIGYREQDELEKELTEYLQISVSRIEKAYGKTQLKYLENADIFHANYYPINDQAKAFPELHKFLTVCDLIPLKYPEFFGIKNKEEHVVYQSIASIDKDKDWVICISQSTKNELCDYIGIDESRVFVTHLGAAKEIFYPCQDKIKIESVRKKYGIPESPYLLSLSTLEPRKNIAHLIRCFAKLVGEQSIQDLQLVLVGTQGWDYKNILQEISNYDSIKNRIIITGRVADEDLAAIYSDALVFIYPSLYEGFGLPPLEAMQCGVPVITSNTSSLPEVVGNAGIMVEPKNADELCHSILDIYNTPSLRADMSLKSLEQSKKFSWEKCTQETIESYKFSLLAK
ncbi:MAG: glycosyltransferase family 4 protein [Okeania sp. SIO3B3]|nr:glycosyltransferase family 4 protein [Okeania sp. SIO3B3]